LKFALLSTARTLFTSTQAMSTDSSPNSEHIADLPAQPISEGVGKHYHRVYETKFKISDKSYEKLLDQFFTDINCFAPQLVATFHPSCEKGKRLKVGDNIDIRISGPWNGPVRVIEANRTHLTLMTLKGHLEAGKIRFSFEKTGERVKFRIESFARSKDRIVDFLYDKLPISRFMQREMWITFCENVANEALKIEAGDPNADFPIAKVDVTTELKEDEHGQWKEL
jgi:hypothetical protein